ncbi:MAG: FkbM family methyltransferase [Candidatus Helarchaeota archaeon]
MKYYSQYGQDKFLNEKIFVDNKKRFFLELGADDGIENSNTLFFEKEKKWNGICIEPREIAFLKLRKNRNCICEKICITDKNTKKDFLEINGSSSQLSGLYDKFDKTHLQRINRKTIKDKLENKVIQVECLTLNQVLGKHKINKVDYLSLDVEGGELDILKSINFNLINISVISVENNYCDVNIQKFLEKNNYTLIKRIKIDEIYIHQNANLTKYHESKYINNIKIFLRKLSNYKNKILLTKYK